MIKHNRINVIHAFLELVTREDFKWHFEPSMAAKTAEF